MIGKLEEKLSKREGRLLDIRNVYSIFIPLIKIDGEYHLIYQVRSQHVKQPGEISFPGGHVEKGESPRQAAIRETKEELNLADTNIKYMGEGDIIHTSYGALVHTYIGEIVDIDFKDISPCEREVYHLFTVPVKYLIEKEPDIYSLGLKICEDKGFPYDLIPNGEDYNWDIRREKVYFYKYKDYVIWGLTGKITESFVRIYKEG